MGSVDRQHNKYGSEFVEPSTHRESEARDAMAQSAYVLDAPRREVVCKAIVSLATEKGWQLLAMHVRSNHVHVVIQTDRDPARTMSDLKARASRDLTRAGFEDSARRRWTRHGSTKHLFSPQQIQRKVEYTLDEPGPPMALFVGRPKEPRTQ